MSKDTARIVACPTCRKPAKWSEENRHRPFCSERCRMIDLGEWANEGHRIPGDPVFGDSPAGDADDQR